jgi:hypothetical protein
MKNKQERYLIAHSAVTLLRDGVNQDNKTKILAAYNAIEEDKSFSWDGLDVIYMEWEELMDEANQILNEM